MSLAKFLIIDTETTGLNPQQHPIIQIAAAAVDEELKLVDTFVSDVGHKAGTYQFSEEALEITGFTHERIQNGPNSKEVASQFLDWMDKYFVEPPTFVGQFFCFDFASTFKFFDDVGMPKEWLERTTNKIIDTKSLVLAANERARLKNKPLPFPVTSLNNPGGLKDTFGIKDLQAHDALGDVLATHAVLVKLLKDY